MPEDDNGSDKDMPTVAFRISRELERQLSDFEEEHGYSRSNALRVLLERGLDLTIFLEQLAEIQQLRHDTYKLVGEMDQRHQEKFEDILDEFLD